MKAILHLWSFLFPFFESLFQFKLGTVLKVGGMKELYSGAVMFPALLFINFPDFHWLELPLDWACRAFWHADNMQQPVLQEKKDFTVWSLLELSLLAIDQI